MPPAPQFKTRFYNSISVEGDAVLKRSSRSRIQVEFNWYKAAEEIIPKHIPRIKEVTYGSNPSLKMELIDGPNLYQAASLIKTDRDLLKLLEAIKAVASQMHSLKVERNISSIDIENMYNRKPRDGLDFFYKHYPEFKKTQIRVNGKICLRADKLLGKLYDHFEPQLRDASSSFIHGDLTFSNLILGKNQKIYLVDPRGAFGTSKLYGDRLYDVAKLFYSCITDFDGLNNHQFNLKRTMGGFEYDIKPVLNIANKKEIFRQTYPGDYQLIQFITATIWLSLLPHLNESADQTITAYLHGTSLINLLNGTLNDG